MVCLGNICRSPLAEGILKSKVSSSEFYIDSAGTAAFHAGEQPDHRSIAVARKNGIDISAQKARKFRLEDFDDFDHIFVMDESNYDNIIRMARNEDERKKVSRILEWDESTSVMNVPDPYYGGPQGFDYVFNLLDQACNQIVKDLQN